MIITKKLHPSNEKLQSKTFKIVFEPDKNFIQEYETLLNNLFGLQFTEDANNPIFTFGIFSKGEETNFYVVVPENYVNIFKKKYAAVNPFFQLEEMDDPMIKFPNIMEDNQSHYVEGYNMKLLNSDKNKKIKLANGQRFMGSLINSMNNFDTTDQSIMEVTIQPLLTNNSKDFANKLAKGLFVGTDLVMKGMAGLLNWTLLSNNPINTPKAEKEKSNIGKNLNQKEDNEIYDFTPQFKTSIKVMSKSTSGKRVFDNIKAMGSVFSDFAKENNLMPVKIKFEELIKRNPNHGSNLSASEIVQFVHLPDKFVLSDNMQQSTFRKFYDRNVPQKGLIFGISPSNNNSLAFPIIPISTATFQKRYKELHRMVNNLSKPILVLGQQGTGKSEWVINYIIGLARLGLSVIVVDPKNDTQQRLIESLDDDLLKRTDYINFGDMVFPPGMNLFRKRKDDDPTENSMIVTSFIALMRKQFASAWGFKIQSILQMAAEAILLNDVSTLNELDLILNDRTFREYMIDKMKALVKDPDKKGKAHIKKLIKYWEQYNDRKDEMIARDIEPVMNKVGSFLSNRLIKSIVSQNFSYDFRKAADNGRITIINIPEGILKENTKLLASMVNKAIWLDLQSRADVDISQRYPTAWIIDEAHEIVDDEFVGVLTMARAYRLGLTLVTQGLSNFKMRNMDNMENLILTNCKNKIAFRLGSLDARNLTDEFDPLTYSDLANCPDIHFYAKIQLENGGVSQTFLGKAPDMAKQLRNYDNFLRKHQSGRFTIDEIEDELDSRMDHIHILNQLSNK